MKLSAKQIKILKIASLVALAVLEIYLIYATAASMYTYHQHPRFESLSGQVAQSSGYRTQFFLCLAFDIVIPLLAGLLVYLYWFKKKRSTKTEEVKPTEGVDVLQAVAATNDAARPDPDAKDGTGEQ